MRKYYVYVYSLIINKVNRNMKIKQKNIEEKNVYECMSWSYKK